MSANDEFHNLLHRVRAGSAEAARILFDRYEPLVRRAARRQLARSLRVYFDSLDCTQDVFASFFTMPADRQRFDSPESFVAYLAEMTRNVVRENVRLRRAQRRDVRRERAIDGTSAWATAAPDPTPSQYAIANEKWSRLLDGLPARDRQVVELLRLGHAQAEIAARLGISTRTVRRIIERLAPEAAS
jgi:RNA polymerase sigma factor (sigma-70 family)